MGLAATQYRRAAFLECRAVAGCAMTRPPAEWVQASIKKRFAHNPKFSPAIIDHILKLVRPQPEEAMQCKHNIMFTAQLIAELPDYVSPTVERRLLQDAVAKLEAA